MSRKKPMCRFLSLLLTIVILIGMLPAPVASAAATKQYSFTLKCTKPGYEFTVYPLATIDDTTGAYTPVSTVTDNLKKKIADEVKKQMGDKLANILELDKMI